jgi:hypothetical protein
LDISPVNLGGFRLRPFVYHAPKNAQFFRDFFFRRLTSLQDRLDILIKRKTYAEKTALDKRGSHRARVKIMGTAEIEREREFFDQTHKINIHEMSTNGLVLTIPATVIQGDILIASFRLPSNGERKVVDCQVMRVKEIVSNGNTTYEVAARAVDKNEVKAYRNMLKNRGK